MPLRGFAPVILVPNETGGSSASSGARISLKTDLTLTAGSGKDPVPFNQVDFDNGGYTTGITGELTVPASLGGPHEVGATVVVPLSGSSLVFDFAIYRGYSNEELYRTRWDITNNTAQNPVVMRAYAGPYIFAPGDRINVWFLSNAADVIRANDATYGPSFFWIRYLCV